MLPSYYVEEACARLRSGLSDQQWSKILPVLGIALDDSEPDYADLASSQDVDPENVRRGWVLLPAMLTLFDLRTDLTLRYVYVGEFESDDGPEFGSVSRLEMLVWPDQAGPPRWQTCDIGILDRAMLAEIDERVLDQERRKSNL